MPHPHWATVLVTFCEQSPSEPTRLGVSRRLSENPGNTFLCSSGGELTAPTGCALCWNQSYFWRKRKGNSVLRNTLNQGFLWCPFLFPCLAIHRCWNDDIEGEVLLPYQRMKTECLWNVCVHGLNSRLAPLFWRNRTHRRGQLQSPYRVISGSPHRSVMLLYLHLNQQCTI